MNNFMINNTINVMERRPEDEKNANKKNIRVHARSLRRNRRVGAAVERNI
jgi:hypothetical protein